MKKTYMKPETEIVLFGEWEIITTSGEWLLPDGDLGDGEGSDQTDW